MGSFSSIFDLSGRVAIITGGVGLLGQEHADALIRAGHSDTLWAIDQVSG